MASIDKIYGTKEQREELVAWLKEHKPKALPYVYDWVWDDDDEHPISNFPEEIDAFLWEHCMIPFVIYRLSEQYPSRPPRTIPLWVKFLDRLFIWIDAMLYLLYDLLIVITFTLITDTKLIELLLRFDNWANELMLKLENK